MDAVVVVLMGAVGELEVSLMHQRGRRQRVAGPVSGKLTVSPIVKFAIDQREETVEGTAVSLTERREQPGDLAFD
jgi:hypothetical protein